MNLMKFLIKTNRNQTYFLKLNISQNLSLMVIMFAFLPMDKQEVEKPIQCMGLSMIEVFSIDLYVKII